MNPIQPGSDASDSTFRYCRQLAAWPALVVTLALAACASGGEVPGQATGTPSAPTGPSSGGPTIPAGSYVVSGEVFSFEQGMIADAAIDIRIDRGTFAYSYWWAYGALYSDGLGLFETTRLPDAVISIQAHKNGYVQPCAIRHVLSSDIAVRVELVPYSAFKSFDPPRPQLSVEPAVTGTVYESTASGRQPVDDASIWVEASFENGIATTVTDLGGGFFVCNLHEFSDVYLYVTKPGFQMTVFGPIDTSGEVTYDIEMTRQ
jgi:hypothetical protein